MAASASHTTKRERLEARISADQKALLQRAAELRGLSMTDFVVSNAIQAARRVLHEDRAIILSEEESLRFAELLLNPPPPGEYLLRSVQQYHAIMGQLPETHAP